MLGECWPSIFDGGPTLSQHRIHAGLLVSMAGDRLLIEHSRGQSRAFEEVTEASE